MRTPSPKHSNQLQMSVHYSSPPPKAYGSKINVNGGFGTVARGNGVVLDKSLLCKALFNADRTAICVCLPRRFGKTFNLSVLEEFFNVLHGDDDAEAARRNRLKLFKGSLLLENHCEFFDENFCKFPVIRISMKDNRNLRAGVLIGVHYVELSDLYSGANNTDNAGKIPDKLMEPELDYFGELFAFTKSEVEVLVNKVYQQYPTIRRYSTAAIIEKAVEWYDGYCFGICDGKFNPHAVLMFLQRLCTTSLDNTACNFWEKTGNQRMVENIVLNNRANIVALATELLQGYRANHSGFVKLAAVWEQPRTWNPKWPIMKLRRRDGAGSEQYVRFLSELETGMGKTDLIITFPATQQHPDQLVVIIEFKRIYKDEFKSSDYPLKRARDGLEQIIDKKYAKTQRSSGGYLKRRLDIGISMGCGEVAMRQRLWKSLTDRLRATDRSISSDFYPQKKANETNEEWDQRLIEADQTVWQDGLGWETMALDTSFYCD
ncbi:hypothetical protein IWW36_001558 [Coemansia brasiliensis]|uniref:AAA-ATPase-like domain-containing protein n=1 Tax=Coemansia brasiliensis TaxID=2650707 RepID=A0A9W8IGF2_9FUNG|nr:hypothetical protein IWW36_001558 [Coemansia brasiliensis]